MSTGSTLRRLSKALPVILANLPAIVGAVKEVRQAVKKEKKPEVPPPVGGTAGAAAGAGNPTG
jgi:hypothetical protein